MLEEELLSDVRRKEEVRYYAERTRTSSSKWFKTHAV